MQQQQRFQTEEPYNVVMFIITSNLRTYLRTWSHCLWLFVAGGHGVRVTLMLSCTFLRASKRIKSCERAQQKVAVAATAE